MSKPTDIELQKSRSIVHAMMNWKFIEMGLSPGPAPDLAQYSLSEMVTSAQMIRDHGEVQNDDGTKSIMVCPDDRLIAELYTITHWTAYDQDVEPIVTGRGKAPVVT